MASRKRRKSKAVAPVNMIDSAMWQKHIDAKLPPPKQQALDRIVLAGMKVMFSPQTHQMMLTELDAKGDIVDNLAKGAAKLMAVLFQQSKGTMPQDLLIPAGGVLLAKACEFLNKSGQAVSETQFQQAIVKMAQMITLMAHPAQGQPGTPAAQPAPQGATTPATTPPSNPLNQGATS